MRFFILLCACLIMNGCWWDDTDTTDEPPYHQVRVNNLTDDVVQVRFTRVYDFGDGQTMIADALIFLDAGAHDDIRVPRLSEIELKTEYRHIINYFRAPADFYYSRSVTIDMHTTDFVPPMPMANG
jgi:hypothetical protein